MPFRLVPFLFLALPVAHSILRLLLGVGSAVHAENVTDSVESRARDRVNVSGLLQDSCANAGLRLTIGGLDR